MEFVNESLNFTREDFPIVNLLIANDKTHGVWRRSLRLLLGLFLLGILAPVLLVLGPGVLSGLHTKTARCCCARSALSKPRRER